jgi:hypothetical protein
VLAHRDIIPYLVPKGRSCPGRDRVHILLRARAFAGCPHNPVEAREEPLEKLNPVPPLLRNAEKYIE